MISYSAIDSFCNEIERILKDCSINPLFQDLKRLLDMIRSKSELTFVFAPQFVLECAANYPASSEIKEKAVGLLSSPKYKHCAWVEEHTVLTIDPTSMFTLLSCNEHTAVGFTIPDSCIIPEMIYTNPFYLLLKQYLENQDQLATADVGFSDYDCRLNMKIYPDGKHLIAYYHLPEIEKEETANSPLVLELRDVQALDLQRKFVVDLYSKISSSCLACNNKLVVGCDDGTFRVLDVDSEEQGTLHTFPDNPRNVCCTASTEGKLLTVGGGVALLWHSLTPPNHVKLTSNVIKDADQPVCFSSNGRLVACLCYGDDKSHPIIKVFNALTTQLVKSSVYFTVPPIWYSSLSNVFFDFRLTFITNVHLLLQSGILYAKVVKIDDDLFHELTCFFFTMQYIASAKESVLVILKNLFLD